MNFVSRLTAAIFLFVLSVTGLFAGGSGLNVVVVVNTNSANSLQLGNYYCEKRQVPPQNVLRTGWSGSMIEWGLTSDFEPVILNPLVAMLSQRGLTNQIEFIVLSMDFPYRIIGGVNSYSSTTAALYYGFKPDPRNPYTCPLATNSASAYAGSEGIFRQTPPISAASNSWLVTMITASNLAQARQTVDSGALADGMFPAQPVLLMKSSDTARNIRYELFDNAIFNMRIRGGVSVLRTNTDDVTGLSGCMGFQTGLYSYSPTANTFAPGAMADSLTSYGGTLFETQNTGQSSLLNMLQAGAAGSYGTVIEPCAYISKFPTPQNYFYQSRGFSLAECYYMSVTNPYEGLIVGEPLSAPFAQPPTGGWENLAINDPLTGVTNLTLHFAASEARRPVQQVDLFVDGLFLRTLTNIAPAAGNILSVTVNGFPTNYTVPSSATVKIVTDGLRTKLNGSSYKNASKVTPFTHGDRIELQYTNANPDGSQVFLTTSNSIGAAPALTTFAWAARSNFLDTIAYGIRSFTIGVGVDTNDYLTLTVTKTNGGTVTVSVTNFTAGTTIDQFLGQFMNAINFTTELQGADGLAPEDRTGYQTITGPPNNLTTNNYGVFNLRARSPGWDAARIQAVISGPFDITPSGTQRLDENLTDLQPRNHLYVTAGLTNLLFSFPLNTTTLSDGWHELTAVAYEGSHVRTQKRAAHTVRIQNTSLTATFNCALCDAVSGTPPDSTLQFSVVPNTNTISRIELFSTGGSWGVVTNQPTALFSVAATSLQLGLHPFYALITRNDGVQYRTETRWARIYTPFSLSVAGVEPVISWMAVTGQVYEVLSTTNVAVSFALRDSLTATSTNAQWTETNSAPSQQFYRVRTQP